MKIFLIGYRCTGKTTIGKTLADLLKFDFIDTDSMIEQKIESSILDFVEKNGWDKFRQIEKETLLKTKKDKNIVIATGGGIILDRENQQFIKNNGFTVWLDASLSTILSRLKKDFKTKDSRPSLTNDDVFNETAKVLKQRIPIYQRISHIKVDTNFNPPEEIANTIKRRLP